MKPSEIEPGRCYIGRDWHDVLVVFRARAVRNHVISWILKDKAVADRKSVRTDVYANRMFKISKDGTTGFEKIAFFWHYNEASELSEGQY